MSNNKLGSLKGKEEGIDDKEEENRFVNLSSIFFLFFFRGSKATALGERQVDDGAALAVCTGNGRKHRYRL